MSTEPVQYPLRPPLWERVVSRSALVFGTCVVLVCMGWLGFGIRDALEAANVNSCSCRFKQITIALQNYHDVYHTFPPAYIADADGKPMHSWRVLILPYLEEIDSYKAYDFNEPWDGPNNRKLADKAGSVFRCPADSGKGLTTNYVAVVGVQTAWPGAAGRKIREITDGTSKTILVVEIADSKIHWMEPRDPSFEEAARGVGVTGGISSHHRGGVNLGWCDAHVSFIANSLDPTVLKSLLTAAGREPVNEPP